MSGPRRKPFVAWMLDKSIDNEHQTGGWWATFDNNVYNVPVVVTPLEPGDPKPGEVWVGLEGKDYEITGAPFVGLDGNDYVAVRHYVGRDGGPITRHLRMDQLRPKPVLKTFRINASATPYDPHCHADVRVDAESKDAALAKLADMLEEVP